MSTKARHRRAQILGTVSAESYFETQSDEVLAMYRRFRETRKRFDITDGKTTRTVRVERIKVRYTSGQMIATVYLEPAT